MEGSPSFWCYGWWFGIVSDKPALSLHSQNDWFIKMPRTNSVLVEELLSTGGAGSDYDGETDLNQFIDTATVIVTRVATCATAKGKPLSSTELELIERWLAAHAYAMIDQPYTQKLTEKSMAKFQGQTKMRLEGTKYGQMALDLDYSGCLENLMKRQSIGILWLGRRKSEQTDYVDRD